MARGPHYNVPFRRRREGKTNYRLRRGLIRSRLPRLVVRHSLKHTLIQLVRAKVEGDEVIVSAHSSELRKHYGWLGNCGNVPAAYLTGLLCGYRILSKGIKKAALDLGLHSSSPGAKVFAALKGVIDAGVDVPHNENVLPDDERIQGRHIANYAIQLLTSDKELYSQMFSRYLVAGLSPQEIPKHFSLVKEKIIASYKV